MMKLRLNSFLISLALEESQAWNSSRQYVRKFVAMKPMTMTTQAATHSNESHSRLPRHFNHAGASPSPTSVTERIIEHMELEQKLGGYAASDAVLDELKKVYENIADLIHAKSPSEIALVESATVAWTRSFYAMAEKKLRTAPTATNRVILISDAEYAANVVAACQWARDHNWTVLSIPSTNFNGESTGIVDLDILDSMLSGRYTYRNEKGDTKVLDPACIVLACITHIPTNSGIVNPVEEIGKKISDYNKKDTDLGNPPLFYLVDACQSVGQLDVNVQNIFCHALVGTGRKYLRGPRGTGFLYIPSSVANHLLPSHIDHAGVPVLQVPTRYQDGDAVEHMIDFAPREGASRFEFWESNIANRLGLGVAVRIAMEKGIPDIENSCKSLSKMLREKLNQIPGVSVHHDSSTLCGIVTFQVDSLSPVAVKDELWSSGFELTVIPATSTPLDSSKTGVPDLVRASISYTNTESEIDSFCETLSSLLKSTRI